MAYHIFRSNYLGQSKIPLTVGNVYKDIKEAYYGGIVDVYRPYGTGLYYYDVNSLYPHSMLEDMPVGEAVFEESNSIRLEDTFGFYYAHITVPEGLEIPVLPVKEGGRMICPGGSFSGWYFSEELKDAVTNYGYTVVVVKGYRYDRGKVFRDYVEDFYHDKSTSTGSRKVIGKLMLNSLYGKFGMKPIFSKVKFGNQEETERISLNNDVLDIKSLGEGKNMIIIEDDQSDDDQAFLRLNVSVGISAAIAAYSRMTINRFKRIEGNPCFYSDTDSIVLQFPLADALIGKEIGKMKLEYGRIKEGIFLAPKVYGLLLEDGEEVVKVKGLNKPVGFDSLRKLLWAGSTLVSNREQ